MKEQLILEFNETTKDLFAKLSLFNQDEFNKIPFEGSWTAGQVAEHLYKSESGIVKALKGSSVPTERNPHQHIDLIQKIFLDYTRKLQSPEFIIPSNEPKNKDQFVEFFEETRRELDLLIANLDLDKTFTDFSFPQLGHLTGWECICFATCHSKRHIRQMKNIAERLKASPTKIDDAA
jgi:uncharacterized damage-inducible protein DinB